MSEDQKRPNFHSLKIFAVFAAFILLSHIGLRCDDQLADAIKWLGPNHSALLRSQQEIQSIWAALLGVHAAVGAIAPVLGFTLLTTTITSSSRIAPAGAVVAAKIGWSKYLQESLALLAGSIVGLLSAPSALGLLLAAASAIYVVLRTLSIFRQGFELIERQEKFDRAARDYLVAAVAAPYDSPLSGALKAQLQAVNSALSKWQAGRQTGARSVPLFSGNAHYATQLLRLDSDAHLVVQSEAKKLGLELHFAGAELPVFIPRGRVSLFSVTKAIHEVNIGSANSPSDLTLSSIDPEGVERLQEILERVLVYGFGQWADDFTRVPMLVRSHVASVIYEAIPNQRPYDLEYGLGTLGFLIDEIERKSPHGAEFTPLEATEWAIEIPYFVFDQIRDAPRARMDYSRQLIDFVRARLWIWFNAERRDPLSRLYVQLLIKLFSLFLRTDIKAAEGVALYIRGLVSGDRSLRSAPLEMVQRGLILLLVEKVDQKALSTAARHLVLKTMDEAIRFSGKSDHNTVRFEAKIGALAVSFFLCMRDLELKQNIEQVLAEFVVNEGRNLSAAVQLNKLSEIEEISERWRWTWWELEQKESGVAHMVEMESWLTRAGLTVLAKRGGELAFVPDESLPPEHALDRYLRLINEGEWTSLLPRADALAVARLGDRIAILLERRKRIVRQRVEGAALDESKAMAFVNNEATSAAAELAEYQSWIASACKLRFIDEVREEPQFGSSILIPKECFVPDIVLDVPVMMGSFGLGQAVEEFELDLVTNAIIQAKGQLSSNDALVSGLWEHLRCLIESGRSSHIWIIAVEVSQYDVWTEYEVVRKIAEEKGIKIRYDNVNGRAGMVGGHLVLDHPDQIAFNRFKARGEPDAVSSVEMEPAAGGLYIGISAITEPMIAAWAPTGGEISDDYSQSVLLRSAWSFEVEVAPKISVEYFSSSPQQAASPEIE